MRKSFIFVLLSCILFLLTGCKYENVANNIKEIEGIFTRGNYTASINYGYKEVYQGEEKYFSEVSNYQIKTTDECVVTRIDKTIDNIPNVEITIYQDDVTYEVIFMDEDVDYNITSKTINNYGLNVLLPFNYDKFTVSSDEDYLIYNEAQEYYKNIGNQNISRSERSVKQASFSIDLRKLRFKFDYSVLYLNKEEQTCSIDLDGFLLFTETSKDILIPYQALKEDVIKKASNVDLTETQQKMLNDINFLDVVELIILGNSLE